MEDKIRELVNKFEGEIINSEDKIYIKIVPEKSNLFICCFKIHFPDKELTFIYFDGKYEIWRIEEKTKFIQEESNPHKF